MEGNGPLLRVHGGGGPVIVHSEHLTQPQNKLVYY